MKKSLISVAAASVLLTFSQPSQAILAALHFNTGMIGVGGIIAVGGIMFQGNSREGSAGFDTGVGLEIAGIVVLGDCGQIEPQFRAINTREAESLDISAEEKFAYNSQLEEINDIAETVVSETAGTDAQEVYQSAHSLWEKYETSLNPLAISAMKKIAESAARD